MKHRHLIPGALLLALGSYPMLAEVSIPNTFSSGTPAVASEVNENFTALKSTLDALQVKVDEQQATIASLEAELSAVQANSVLELDGYVSLEADDNILNEYRVLFSGVNVQVINGQEQETANGMGNLIVGYDEERPFGSVDCSDGEYDDRAACEGAGGTWAMNHKSGSHNLVVGNWNGYSQTGGIVAGYRNTITRDYANVTGGAFNIASGSQSSISGGARSIASGSRSSISGGDGNIASGSNSSVSAGLDNTASGEQSSITAGRDNTASGIGASVSGGRNNTASGDSGSSVSGGHTNTASGVVSSVNGGVFNTASGPRSSILGGENLEETGNNQTIP